MASTTTTRPTPPGPGFYSTAVAQSSVTDDWATPLSFFNKLNREFGFGLDVCASKTNHKCTNWYGLDHSTTSRRDGLQCDWAHDAGGKTVWMNPPYGRNIGEWMNRAVNASDDGATVVCLVPARTDTVWFQTTALARLGQQRAEIRFVRGRLTFGFSKSPAPFPSAVVVFHPKGWKNNSVTTVQAMSRT